ncbi:MAG: phage holin family protein [Candidatus Thorarchaeota archaeon]
MAKCAFCDANFDTGPGDVLLVCPFCGTAQTTDGTKFKDHYMIRVHFDQSEAQTTLLDWVSKQLGAPQDLPATAKFVEYQQVWYPFWISRVDARTDYQGMGRDATFHDEWPQLRGAYKHINFFWKPESGQFTRRHEINIAGVKNIDADVRNHPIPTRAKEYFSHAHAEEFDGKVLHSNMTEDEAKAAARQIAIDRQTGLVLQEVSKIESRTDDIKVGETFLIHVPVWELSYRYGNKKYKSSVSAPTGYVIESQYPRSMSFRAGGIGVGLIMLLMGVALIVLALDLLGIGAILPGGGLFSGALLAIIGLVLLYKGASRKEAKESV